MNEEELFNNLSELESFIMDNNLSYYEAAAYAYKNDRHDWLRLFRSKKYNGFLHIICKQRKYNKPFMDALKEYEDAKIAYNQRHTADDGTWKD